MIDEKLYRETFSRLRASQEAKEEAFHMMKTRKKPRYLSKALRAAAMAAVMAMALAVTAGAVNAATDGQFFRQFTVIWAGEDALLAQDQEGNQVYITAGESDADLVTKENGRLILHADRDIDITRQMEQTGSYHYEYEVLAVWEDGSRESRTVTIDITGDLDQWTVTRNNGGSAETVTTITKQKD